MILVHTRAAAGSSGENEQLETVYRRLLLQKCTELAEHFPQLFGSDGFDHLVLPSGLLAAGSCRGMLVEALEEEEWRHGTEIIGWMYQFYVLDGRAQTTARKVEPDKIAEFTQLFTPAWLSKFLVQNSLGAIWERERPDSAVAGLPFFVAEERSDNDRAAAAPAAEPGRLTLMDPCCGTGNILLEAYYLFKTIFLEAGITPARIPRLILERCIFGLDIDEIAVMLASFSLLAAAYKDEPALADHPPRLNIAALPVSGRPLRRLAEELQAADGLAPSFPHHLLEEPARFFDEYPAGGSLPAAPPSVIAAARESLDALGFSDSGAHDRLRNFLTGILLAAGTYRCLATNPPYLSARFMPGELKRFAQKHYPAAKGDLCAMFIERSLSMLEQNGLAALLTMHSWMFLPSFRDLRLHILQRHGLRCLVHLGPHAFAGISGEVVQAAAFVLEEASCASRPAAFIDARCGANQSEKERVFLRNKSAPIRKRPSAFEKLPGAVFAYWAQEPVERLFREGKPLGSLATIRQGMATGNNAEYVRRWFEVPRHDIAFGMNSLEDALNSGKTWVPYNKGGGSRRWYGNNEYVLRFDRASFTELSRSGNRLPSRAYYFRPAVTWNLLGSGDIGVRYQEAGFAFDVNGMCLFTEQENQAGEEDLYVFLAYLASAACGEVLQALNPTLASQAGNVKQIPFPALSPAERREAAAIADEAVQLAKDDWNDRETSWDFLYSPLLRMQAASLKEAVFAYQEKTTFRNRRLRELETANDFLFSKATGIASGPRCFENKVDASSRRIARDFVSYLTSCFVGRYCLPGPHSADPGDALAAGVFPLGHGRNQPAVEAVETALQRLWPRSVEEDLAWLSGELLERQDGRSPRERLHTYFTQHFFKDHRRRYFGKPIYFELNSGPKREFQALLYLHRFDMSTLEVVKDLLAESLLKRAGGRSEAGELYECLCAASISAEDFCLNNGCQTLSVGLTRLFSRGVYAGVN